MKLQQAIDATKYDIRVLWTGLKEEHVSADAGVVEGYPLDPPDAGAWLLVEFGIETTKDADRYWTLWVREKTRGKRRGRPKKVTVASEEKKPKARKPRTEKSEPEAETGAETN